jgi:hypothetical protein
LAYSWAKSLATAFVAHSASTSISKKETDGSALSQRGFESVDALGQRVALLPASNDSAEIGRQAETTVHVLFRRAAEITVVQGIRAVDQDRVGTEYVGIYADLPHFGPLFRVPNRDSTQPA